MVFIQKAKHQARYTEMGRGRWEGGGGQGGKDEFLLAAEFQIPTFSFMRGLEKGCRGRWRRREGGG